MHAVQSTLALNMHGHIIACFEIIRAERSSRQSSSMLLQEWDIYING